MTDIPEDVMRVARAALKEAWDEHGELFNPLSNSISEGLWVRFEGYVGKAIMAEREDWTELVSNPNAVHVNMLRGTIAKPSMAQIIHLYGEQEIFDHIEADRRARFDTGPEGKTFVAKNRP